MYNSNEYLTYSDDCMKPKNYIPSMNNKTVDVKRDNVCTNSGFNYGISSRLRYDKSYIHDDIQQSVAPIDSVLDPNRVKNCNQCLTLNGPRPGLNGWGNNIPIPNPNTTPAQQLVDIDSIMSNRNVKASRDKRGMVNDIDVFKFKTYDSKLCDKGLDPLSSIATYPKQLYREMSINRFYDLNINPQVNIYWDRAVNSQLEAKDNFDNPYPYFLTEDNALPKELKCEKKCESTCSVNVYDRYKNKNPYDEEIVD